MNDMTATTVTDRRGRVFVNGIFFDFECEIETFRALAKKYLIQQELKEVALLSDPPQIRFQAVPAPAVSKLT